MNNPDQNQNGKRRRRLSASRANYLFDQMRLAANGTHKTHGANRADAQRELAESALPPSDRS